MTFSHRRSPCSSEAGFTLIEILLATLLFLLVFFPIVTTLSIVMKSLAESGPLVRGWVAAHNEMESLLSLPLPDLENGMEEVTVANVVYPFVRKETILREQNYLVFAQVGFSSDQNQLTAEESPLKTLLVRLFLREGENWRLVTTMGTLRGLM